MPTSVALYLPQFHPTPENDEWWGRGFTEWTNAARARPLFRGHYQPHVPADLGYYDLRLAETRVAQAELARRYGVDAFCYYHYWFGNGRRMLQRPFDEVLASGTPDFPFCLAWANESWAGVWHGLKEKRTLIEQTYPGREDDARHFECLLPAFRDPRYLRVLGRPLFVVYKPTGLPEPRRFTDTWRDLAAKAGLPGLYLACQHHDPGFDAASMGFDAIVHVPILPKRRGWHPWSQPVAKLSGRLKDLLNRPTIIPYERMIDRIAPKGEGTTPVFPTVIPNWDNTPRSQGRGLVLHGSTPERFADQVRKAVRRVGDLPPGEQVLFIKSWNEWAEGNHLEPDLRFGHGYLEAFAAGAMASTR